MDIEPRPHVRKSSPRWTVRNLALLVAGFAVLFSSVHRRPPRPGFYLAFGGLSAGVCENRSEGRLVFAGGELGTWTYQGGLWRSRGDGLLLAGAEYRDGRVTLRSGSSYLIVW